MKANSYRKIGGSEAFSLMFQYRYFLAPDHLLVQKSTTFKHSYNRFFLNDIQAIYLVPAKGWGFWIAFWATQILMANGFLLFGGGSPIFPGIWASLAFLGLVVVLIKGPKCRTYLETAAQTVKLTGLSNRRKSLRIMDELKQAVDAVQGELSPADVVVSPDSPEARRPVETSTTRTTVWHWGHFSFWLVNALLLGWIFLRGKSDLSLTLYMFAAFAAFAFVIVSLVIGVRKRQKANALAWATYVGFAMFLVRSLVTYLFVVFQAAFSQMTNPADILRIMLRGDFLNGDGYRVWMMIEIGISLILGIVGLLLCAAKSDAGHAREVS